MAIEYINKGDSVNVEYRDDDYFDHDFTGIVRGFRNGYVVVEDQDGDCWDVEPDQVKLAVEDDE